MRKGGVDCDVQARFHLNFTDINARDADLTEILDLAVESLMYLWLTHKKIHFVQKYTTKMYPLP